MIILGRSQQQEQLARLCESSRPEFAVVYGRRRVGKTYLVREYFGGTFAFWATGIAGGNAAEQLTSFNDSLVEHGGEPAQDWFDAFRSLRHLLESDDVRRDPASGKLVVFIDEMPWLDAPRTSFRAALELFWNRWGSARDDLLLIVCGSASSWIAKHLFKNRGGLHNRVTARIYLPPFTLAECEDYYRANGHILTRTQMIEAYMVFGGVPFYLDLLDRRLSPVQNVDNLCFAKRGELVDEFDELYRSLFRHAERHIDVVRALARKGSGLTRQEIAKSSGLPLGGSLTTTLDELEASDFIRRYRPFGRAERGSLYQLIDPFSLFYLRFMDRRTVPSYWQTHHQTPKVSGWRGYAFELVCLLHEPHILQALGIRAISSDVSSWRSSKSDPGAQIDLVIDRADGIVNLCEMKWCDGEFAITKTLDEQLRNKRLVFVTESGTRKAAHLTLVTPYGAVRNAYLGNIQSEVTGDDLFVHI